MQIAGLWLTVVGLAASLVGAGWLLFGIRADDPRFTHDGQLFPGEQSSVVLPAFIRAQQRPTMLVVLGGGVQVVGGVLAIISA